MQTHGAWKPGFSAVLLLVVLLVCFPAPLLAAPPQETFYVTTTGVDSPLRDGRSMALAWRTIGYALDQSEVSDGDILQVYGDSTPTSDDYVENVIVDKVVHIQGYSAQLRASDPNLPALQVISSGVQISHMKVCGAENETGILLENVKNCIISGNFCGIEEKPNHTGIALVGGEANSLLDNYVEYNANGIELTQTQGNIIDGNYIRNNDKGISVSGTVAYPCSGNLINDNIIIGEGSDSGVGIHLMSDSSANVVSSNMFSSWHATISISQGPETIVHNDFYDCAVGFDISSLDYPLVFALLNHFTCSKNVSSPSLDYSTSPAFPLVYFRDGEKHSNYLGNRYADYFGTDADGDGVGDSPYEIWNLFTAEVYYRDLQPLIDIPGNYHPKIWMLGTSPEGDEVLREGIFDAQGGYMELVSQRVLMFVDPDPQELTWTMTGESESLLYGSGWSGWITFARPWPRPEELQMVVGYSDENGANFVSGPVLRMVDIGSGHFYVLIASHNTFVIPSGKHLALQLTNLGTEGGRIVIGGAASLIKAPNRSHAGAPLIPYLLFIE